MSEPTNDQQRAILEDLLAPNANPKRIAKKHGVSYQELAQIIAAPETTGVMRAFGLLSDATASLTIGRARLRAIGSLRSISIDTENPESARKACVDLIKATPAPLAPVNAPSAVDEHQSDTLDESTRAMLRDALEAFARSTAEGDDDQ